MNIGANASSTGVYNLSGAASAIYTSYLNVGYFGNGVFNQTAGTVNADGALYGLEIGQFAYGEYNLGGTGQLTTTYGELVGAGLSGVFNQTGGINTPNVLVIAPSNATGAYNLSGGSVYAQAVFVGGELFVPGGKGTFSVSGTGSLNVFGTMEVFNTPGTGITLSGGSITLDTLQLDGGSSQLNWTGGALNITGANRRSDWPHRHARQYELNCRQVSLGHSRRHRRHRRYADCRRRQFFRLAEQYWHPQYQFRFGHSWFFYEHRRNQSRRQPGNHLWLTECWHPLQHRSVARRRNIAAAVFQQRRNSRRKWQATPLCGPLRNEFRPDHSPRRNRRILSSTYQRHQWPNPRPRHIESCAAGLTNQGNISLSAGITDVYGLVNNNTGSASRGISITSNANVTFWNDVANTSGFFKVNPGNSATFFGAFSGNGITGAGNVDFESDINPGFSPAIVTFGGNVSLGAAAP